MTRGCLLVASMIILLFIPIELYNAEVITLTPETFSDKVKEKDTAWFVKFCVPWCKHCKKLGNLWEELGKAMEGDDEIEIGEVDCGLSRSVCTKVEIHSYPTFKLFYNGEEVTKYQGKRDVESLKAFVTEETEKAAEKAQLEDEELHGFKNSVSGDMEEQIFGFKALSHHTVFVEIFSFHFCRCQTNCTKSRFLTSLCYVFVLLVDRQN